MDIMTTSDQLTHNLNSWIDVAAGGKIEKNEVCHVISPFSGIIAFLGDEDLIGVADGRKVDVRLKEKCDCVLVQRCMTFSDFVV